MHVVDIWCLSLDVDEALSARLETVLSSAERGRADRFHSALDRRRYITRRGRLRELLARRLDCSANDVRIVTNELGKPFVESGGVTFSLSQSRGMALYAFASGLEIGCDLELRDVGAATRDAAKLFFSPIELKTAQALSEDRWIDRFFRCWTCKEAYLKARGVGFTISPAGITVAPDQPLRFIELPDEDPAEWSLCALELPQGYTGTLAVRGTAPVVRFR